MELKSYDHLAERLYEEPNDPVALVRCQNKVEVPWVLETIRRHIGYHAEILDMGCGAGHVTNSLAQAGHEVTGVDLSSTSLKIAEAKDVTGKVNYLRADVYRLPFSRESFDVVVAMDLLEHVMDPQKIITQATRVLRPGGLFIYSTVNKNPLSWLIVIKGIPWIVKNTPQNSHLYSLFISPRTLEEWMEDVGLDPIEKKGIRPVLMQKSLFDLLSTGEVPENLRFKFTKQCPIGYTGFAKKLREH
ncbi:MAG: 3-demethylubiquinone-9 3-O-methyltransferase [Bdellovibrio sp.]|nr:3-demethylubiquinone-9 3-O-methyltransferase [Bdellovibrio sp.]